MSNNVITIRKETAQNFLPADMHRRGEIDLHELSKLAKVAMEGSELSLAAAKDIADGNFFSRLWNSEEMQKHIIQSISYLSDISKVNLGLSAICNDLAAANLEHASRIDANHHATNQQLNQIQQLTGELLLHLRRAREPALLDWLLPALTKANPQDQDEIRGWLRTLTEKIDLQYVVLQENLDKLSRQNDNTVESVTRFRVEIAALSESLKNQKSDAIQQMGLLSNRVTASEIESGQLADKAAMIVKELRQLTSRLTASVTESAQRAETIRKSLGVLAAAMTTLKLQLARHQSDFQTAFQAEQTSRKAMEQAVVSLIKQREGAIRTTIGELNTHLLKRMLWGVGGILALQILGFGFLAFKMGLFR